MLEDIQENHLQSWADVKLGEKTSQEISTALRRSRCVDLDLNGQVHEKQKQRKFIVWFSEVFEYYKEQVQKMKIHILDKLTTENISLLNWILIFSI